MGSRGVKSQKGEAALSSLDFTPCSEGTLARAVLAAVSLGMAWAVNSPCSKVILFPWRCIRSDGQCNVLSLFAMMWTGASCNI